MMETTKYKEWKQSFDKVLTFIVPWQKQHTMTRNDDWYWCKAFATLTFDNMLPKKYLKATE